MLDPHIEAVSQMPDDVNRILYVKKNILPMLTPPKRRLAAFLFNFLHRVAVIEANQVDATALATVWVVSMTYVEDDLKMYAKLPYFSKVIELMILYPVDIFGPQQFHPEPLPTA